MKGCSAKIFCITVLYVAGIYNVSGQSTLQPAIVHSCPNETVIFTCYGRQAMSMEWIMEPYVLEEDAKSFVAALAVNNRNIFTFTYTDFISSKLTNLTGYENKTADMTVTLTIQPIDEMNEANITCKVDDLLLFATLFVAGAPHHTKEVITYQAKETYFTAVLELGDMFDGGGVPIDHYIIQLHNGTQLETPDPTHSFDIMYNTTLPVNISAHNCAGYSDPFPLDIEYYREDSMIKMATSTVYTSVVQKLESTTLIATPSPILPSKTTTQVTWSIMIATVTAAVAIIIIALITISIVILYRAKMHGVWRCTNRSQQEMKCGVVGNPAYDVVHVQGSAGDRLGPDYNMDNNPLYEMRIMSNERHSHKTTGPHVYETVDNVAV